MKIFHVAINLSKLWKVLHFLCVIFNIFAKLWSRIRFNIRSELIFFWYIYVYVPDFLSKKCFCFHFGASLSTHSYKNPFPPAMCCSWPIPRSRNHNQIDFPFSTCILQKTSVAITTDAPSRQHTSIFSSATRHPHVPNSSIFSFSAGLGSIDDSLRNRNKATHNTPQKQKYTDNYNFIQPVCLLPTNKAKYMRWFVLVPKQSSGFESKHWNVFLYLFYSHCVIW